MKPRFAVLTGGQLRRESSDSRRISGVALTYGESARIAPGIEERFAPGAFGSLDGEAFLNLAHDRGRLLARYPDGGLSFEDTPEALRFAADLPETREADDTLALIASGVLRSVSIEFVPLRESRGADGARIVERATLRGIGLVDRPAYQGSVLDRAEGRGGGRRFFR